MDKKSSAEPVLDEGDGQSAPVHVAYVQIAPSFSDIVSEDRLRMVAEGTLHYEGTAGEATLVITDDEGIQGLNRDFLGKDAPTDVLSFPALEDAPGGGTQFVAAPEAGGYLGDVIISYPSAVAQAEEQGHPVEQELDLLIVHGMLHLLGYDHSGEAEKAVMWAKQKEILGRFWRLSSNL
jgi:probable rRNA maturation factor